MLFFILVVCFFFFFNDTATTEIYTLSLHDALPICARHRYARAQTVPVAGPRAVRRDRPALVRRRVDPAPRLPRLRAPPRDAPAGHDAELPPHGPVLVLPT